MKCCEDTKVDLYLDRNEHGPLSRRTLLKGAGSVAGLAGVAVATGGTVARAQTPIKLAFCSQLLCVVPYEVTRAQELFAAEGLDVELV